MLVQFCKKKCLEPPLMQSSSLGAGLTNINMIPHCFNKAEVWVLGSPVVVFFYVFYCTGTVCDHHYKCNGQLDVFGGKRVMWWIKIWLFFSVFIIPSTSTLAEMQPQTMTEPPPCFTDGCRHSLLCLSPDLRSSGVILRRISMITVVTDFQCSSCVITSAFFSCLLKNEVSTATHPLPGTKCLKILFHNGCLLSCLLYIDTWVPFLNAWISHRSVLSSVTNKETSFWE